MLNLYWDKEAGEGTYKLEDATSSGELRFIGEVFRGFCKISAYLLLSLVLGKLSRGNQQKGQRISYRKANKLFSVGANVKEISFDQSSRAALQAGIDKLVDSVGLTHGPRGREYWLLHVFYILRGDSMLSLLYVYDEP
ncbi:unnamed protein product [Microthlaspi erraticum]|uniref:Uncharacterized protein n=1 Tax=Microthlaspi erraticum TaxID=1685480 RepID=A0A6D2JL53_9BRAS|nr:unnamed protein product [Microthlaspi erraticum]